MQYFTQRWATPTLKLELTPELAIFFIGVEVNFNRNAVELERDLRVYRVELEWSSTEMEWSCCLFSNSISWHKRRTKEIFDIKGCTCPLQITYIDAVHSLTITVESLCVYNRHTKEMRQRERERIKKNICLI